MTPWNNMFLFVLLVILLPLSAIQGQNLYDLEHTQKFADYLFTSGQYNLAAEEYERVVFLNPANESAKLRLIRSYKRNGDMDKGIDRMLALHDYNVSQLSVPFSMEYVEMNLKLQNYPAISNLLDKNSKLPGKFKTNTRLSMHLLDAKWEEARDLTAEKPSEVNGKLLAVVEESMTLNYKQPWLGTTLSVILPGSGKVYAGRWKDGIISFIFIAGSAWQAYRGFDKFGTGSAYGWIFGSVSLGFYTGNIFGSWKAVKQYNTGLDVKLQHKAAHIIYSDH